MKSGIFVTLETLHPEDRFNIIAFSSVNQPLFKKPMHPNKETIQAAEAFLFRLRHHGSTNIFSALDMYIGDKYRAGSRPLIVFLISDGNVNSGKIVDNSELINTVSNRNNDGAHIYTFACGPDKNSFLMDLLAYRNRGESKYVKEVSGSHVKLARFIYDVSDVKVADLDYQTSSNLSEEIFPKRLQNLYKGKTLSLYGYYQPGVKSIDIRITGKDSSGVKREIVFSKKINDAEKADENLPEKWAEQYIYHLYSLLTVRYSDNIVDKILRTAKRFRVKIPYLDEHVKPAKRTYMK
jgi:Ca-activated chloride channel family protein